MFQFKIVNGAGVKLVEVITLPPNPSPSLLPPSNPVLGSSKVAVEFVKDCRICSVSQSASAYRLLMWETLWEHNKFEFSPLFVLLHLTTEQKSLSCLENIIISSL